MSLTSLQWPDYVILASFLAISLGIGVYHSLTGGRQRTTQEFIMADRRLKIIPTSISLFVSFQSAIMVLGMTAEMYLYGAMMFAWTFVSLFVCVVITERLIIPWMYPLKLVSVNDYFERRFDSKVVRMLGAATGVLGAILYMGVAMYAPSAALENATGLPTSVSIPLMAVVSVLYTALGGMRAVIWTDVFQFVMMVAGLIAIMIKGFVVVGGFSKVWEICAREGRLVATNWNLDPTVRHTCWGFIIGYAINWVKVYGLSQASIQRYTATESLHKARTTLLLNLPALWISYFIVCSIGLTVFAYYASIRCDPLLNGDVTSPNQLLSLFVVTIFSNAPGFAGLFLATLYGGALSSVSSSLSGAAANFWDDILKIRLHSMRETRKALLNRLLVVVFGFLATFVAFLATLVPGPIMQVMIMFSSAVNGPLLGVFFLGGISKHGNWKGALIGCLSAQVINLWLSVGAFSLRSKHPALPPASTAGCPGRNVTWSYALYDNYTTSIPGATLYNDYTLATDTSLLDNSSSASMFDSPVLPVVNALTGQARFYSLSYLWYTAFGAVNCFAIGLAISLIFRDKVAEAKVDDNLLMSFRHCLTWGEPRRQRSDNSQHRNQSNDNKDEQIPFQQSVTVAGDDRDDDDVMHKDSRH